MAATPTPATTSGPTPKRTNVQALAVLTTLFFMWGFITVGNDVMIPYFKRQFGLGDFESLLVQTLFFAAYFVMAIPGALVISKYGYKKSMIIGLATIVAGCLLFIPSEQLGVFGVYLFAFFLLASGITLLQVGANPFVAVLGPPDGASMRLNLTQGFNSVGTMLAGPIFGFIIFSTASDYLPDFVTPAVEMYVLIAIICMALILLLYFAKLPSIQEEEATGELLNGPMVRRLFGIPHLRWGILGIFFYVGGEVAIGSLIVNYLMQGNVLGLSEEMASNYLAYYWGAAMVGRFSGVLVLNFMKPQHLLSLAATAVIVLLLVTTNTTGATAAWSVLAIGLFNSIMFPTIFTLAIKDLGPLTNYASGLLVMAIVGGAIVPPVQGLVSDSLAVSLDNVELGRQLSFYVPLVCYVYILFYGARGYRIKT